MKRKDSKKTTTKNTKTTFGKRSVLSEEQGCQERYSVPQDVEYKHLNITDRFVFVTNLEDSLKESEENNFVVPILEPESEEELEEECSSEASWDEALRTSLEDEEAAPRQRDLRTCSVREYIEHTVGAALLLALGTLERERPDDPVEFLAEYLLHYKNEQEEEEVKLKEATDEKDLLKYFREVRRKDKI